MGTRVGSTTPTIRARLARLMRLPAAAGEQIGIRSQQLADLRAGREVVLTREQIRHLLGPSERPAALDEHDTWRLVGDSMLVPEE